MAHWNLDSLLAPLSVTDFFDKYLEKDVLLLQGRAADLYQGLFASSQLDVILWGQPQDTLRESLILLHDGERIYPPRSASGDLRRWIDSQYDHGATVLLENVGRYSPPLGRLQRELERVFRGSVGVNLYVTPPGSQGFEPHFDTHDVFVLQVEGTKHWKLYDSFVKFPTAGQGRAVPPEILDRPTNEVDLAPGDLMYLPRGTVHEARAGAAPSVHLTIGVSLVTWGDVLQECLRAATHHTASLRRSLATMKEPDPALATVVSAFRALIGAGNSTSEDEVDPIRVAIDTIQERFVTNLAVLPRPAMGVLGRVALIATADDWVQRTDGMLAHVSIREATVRMAMPGADPIVEPLASERAMRFVVDSAQPFRVRDIPLDDGDASKVDFVRRLVVRGFVQPLARVRLLEPEEGGSR